jgi:hypothetical protein
MNILIIDIDFFVGIDDLLEFNVPSFLPVDCVSCAHDQLVDVHVQEEVSLFAYDMLHGIVDRLQNSVFHLQPIADSMDLEASLHKQTVEESLEILRD